MPGFRSVAEANAISDGVDEEVRFELARCLEGTYAKEQYSFPRTGPALVSHCASTTALFVTEIDRDYLNLYLRSVRICAAPVAIAGHRRVRFSSERC